MPNWKKLITSGSDAVLGKLTLDKSGSTVLDIQGSQGQLFSITDDLSGDLFSVADISGIPILNVNASGDSYFADQLEVQGLLTGSTADFSTAVSASAFSGSLSGNASTATTAVYSTYTDILTAVDDRDMKPNTSGVGSTIRGVRPFFTSLGGMTGTANSDYQDVLVLDTYSDTSGGQANALSFDKNSKLIKHWQAGQTATSWGTPKTIAYTDSDITGNASTVTTNANLTGHITSTGNAAVLGSFTTAQLNTAISDGTINSQTLPTDFVSAANGGTFGGAITASAFVGDGSALTGVSVAEATTVVDSFSSQTSVATTHNFGTKNVLVNVYDSNDAYIIPSSITTTNDNTVTTTFNVSTSGRVVVAKGGHIVGGTSANPQHNSIGVGTAASTTAGEIRATNDITAFYSSDKRLKSNVTNIVSPLEKLNKINGVTFDWVETPGVHSHTGSDVGVIAQEIEEVLPDIVTTRDNGYKAVKYDKLVALLIESNKELNKKVEELQIKVDNLLKI